MELAIYDKKSISLSEVLSKLSSGVIVLPNSSMIYPFPKSKRTSGNALIVGFKF